MGHRANRVRVLPRLIRWSCWSFSLKRLGRNGWVDCQRVESLLFREFPRAYAARSTDDPIQGQLRCRLPVGKRRRNPSLVDPKAEKDEHEREHTEGYCYERKNVCHMIHLPANTGGSMVAGKAVTVMRRLPRRFLTDWPRPPLPRVSLRGVWTRSVVRIQQ